MSSRSGSVAQSLSFLRILESDLKVIAAETKRKLPEAREAAERGLQRLREIDVTTEDDADSPQKPARRESDGGSVSGGDSDSSRVDVLSSALAAAEEVTLAFCAACDPSMPKVSLRAVGCLHKLVMHSAIAPERLGDVLQALQKLVKSKEDPAILLKVLEALLSVLTSRKYRSAADETTQSAGLAVLLELSTYESIGTVTSVIGSAAPPNILQQTAEVAFRQVASEIFLEARQSIRAESTEGSPTNRTAAKVANLTASELPEEIRCSYLLFRDLCSLISGDNCTWLKLSRLPRLRMILEVVEEALKGELFLTSTVMRTLLTSRLCPSLHERLCSSKDPLVYKMLLRIIFVLVIRYLNELQADMEVLLMLLVRTVGKPSSVGEASSTEHQLLAMEALRAAFSHQDGSVIRRLNATFDASDQTTGIVRSTIETASKLAGKCSLEVSPAAVSLLKGTVTPFESPILRQPDKSQALETVAFAMCLTSFQALLTVASSDSHSERLLGETWEKLLSLLASAVDIADPDTEKSALVAAIVAEVGNTISLLVSLAYLPALKSAQDAAVDVVTSSAAKRVQRGEPKAMEAIFNTLFKSAIGADPPLSSKWQDVIETVELLDKSLGRPDLNSMARFQTLRDWLDSFYTSALDLNGPARQNIVATLVSISRSELSRANNKAGAFEGEPFRLHATFRLCDFMQQWLQKKKSEGMDGATWGMVTGHLVALGSDHTDRATRDVAVKSTGHLASTALSFADPELLPHAKILGPLRDLLASTYRDTRVEALNTVRTLLETRGERIRGEGAWQQVVDVLRLAVSIDTTPDENGGSTAASQKTSRGGDVEGELSLVQMGFGAVQLVAGDFLPVMAFSVVGQFVSVLVLYAIQNDDVNSALTAVSLLWGVADFLVKVDESNHKDELWQALFEGMRKLSLDDRPEVRNGAIKSLSGTVMAHGSHLSDQAWQGCLSHCIIPLVGEVMAGKANQTRPGATAPSSGGDKRLIVHHSRDTPQKQWNESRHLVLTGVARLLRKYTGKLMDLHVFLEAWNATLSAAVAAAAGKSAAKEIATAGVSTLLELLTVAAELEHTENPDRARELWLLAWQAVDSIVWDPSDPDKNYISNAAALTQLCEGLRALASSEKTRLSALDAQRLVEVLLRVIMMRSASGAQGSTASMPTISPEVERCALTALTALEFDAQDSEAWTMMIGEMLRLLGASGRKAGDDDQVQEKMLLALRNMYSSSKLPRQVKVSKLKDVMETVFPIMNLRNEYVELAVATANLQRTLAADDKSQRSTTSSRGAALSSFDSPLWTSAFDTFRTAVANGCDQEGQYGEDIWTYFVDVAEQFLFPRTSSAMEQLHSAHSQLMFAEDEMENHHKALLSKVRRTVHRYDVLVVQTLLAALHDNRNVDVAHTQRLLGILARGAGEGQKRSHFARVCQSGLFQVASLEQTSRADAETLASTVRGHLIDVCQFVLGSYVTDEKRSGRCPLPAPRRAEVLYLLRELRLLEVCISNRDNSARIHLARLYPTICECIESKDEDVRTWTRELLVEAGGSLDL